MAITHTFTIWGTTHYLGPFGFRPLSHGVLETQLFLLVTSLSALSVAALASEREALSRSVQASAQAHRRGSRRGARRLERDLHDGAQQRLVALAAHLGLAAESAREKPETATASFESAQAELLVADRRAAGVRARHPPDRTAALRPGQSRGDRRCAISHTSRDRRASGRAR